MCEHVNELDMTHRYSRSTERPMITSFSVEAAMR